jgi:hypothetical protein
MHRNWTGFLKTAKTEAIFLGVTPAPLRAANETVLLNYVIQESQVGELCQAGDFADEFNPFSLFSCRPTNLSNRGGCTVVVAYRCRAATCGLLVASGPSMVADRQAGRVGLRSWDRTAGFFSAIHASHVLAPSLGNDSGDANMLGALAMYHTTLDD